jgi:hypothetical protein
MSYDANYLVCILHDVLFTSLTLLTYSTQRFFQNARVHMQQV